MKDASYDLDDIYPSQPHQLGRLERVMKFLKTTCVIMGTIGSSPSWFSNIREWMIVKQGTFYGMDYAFCRVVVVHEKPHTYARITIGWLKSISLWYIVTTSISMKSISMSEFANHILLKGFQVCTVESEVVRYPQNTSWRVMVEFALYKMMRQWVDWLAFCQYNDVNNKNSISARWVYQWQKFGNPRNANRSCFHW